MVRQCWPIGQFWLVLHFRSAAVGFEEVSYYWLVFSFSLLFVCTHARGGFAEADRNGSDRRIGLT